MRIGLVCPYNLFHGGGVQECIFAMQKELKRRGHTAKIITPLPRGYEDSKTEDIIFIGNATSIKSFHTTPQISVSVSAEAVEAMLGREHFDVLHFHEPWMPVLSRQILSRSNCINIATFHAKLPETVMTSTIERVITPYTKSIMKYLHTLTAVSEAAATYVYSLTNKPVEIIPNGIDLKKYKKKRMSSGVPDAGLSAQNLPKTILFIGRLERRKGLTYLIDAYELFTRKYPGAELIIAGDGVDREKLEKYAAEKHTPNVHFRGYISEEEKLQLLRTSDLFCSPAPYGESFGIVLLEAMAMGLVTVAGNNSGYSTVLKERGTISLVNPKDTDDFVRRLELLLYDEPIRNLWRTWAREYAKQFDYPKIVDRYEELYVNSKRSTRH